MYADFDTTYSYKDYVNGQKAQKEKCVSCVSNEMIDK